MTTRYNHNRISCVFSTGYAWRVPFFLGTGNLNTPKPRTSWEGDQHWFCVQVYQYSAKLPLNWIQSCHFEIWGFISVSSNNNQVYFIWLPSLCRKNYLNMIGEAVKFYIIIYVIYPWTMNSRYDMCVLLNTNQDFIWWPFYCHIRSVQGGCNFGKSAVFGTSRSDN